MQTGQFLSEGQKRSIRDFQNPNTYTLAEAAAIENNKRITVGPVEVVQVCLHSAIDHSLFQNIHTDP